MGLKTFSIVICSDGRAAALAETLECLPFLAGPEFEICVVRGPTEDGTDSVLAAWHGLLKTARNPIRNLSISRNIGLAMAAGDIVAFLDDDAVPEPEWLTDLLAAFDTPEVACAGGMNRHRSGSGLQYAYAVCDRMGRPRLNNPEAADNLCVAGAAEFPYVQGTNSAIRRTDLEAIGGFDEEYEFYLDETDVCCRLVDAGRKIRQLPNAFVCHRALPSRIRSVDGVTHSLYSVLKNKLYFSIINNQGHHSESMAISDFESFAADQEKHLAYMAGKSPDGSRWLEKLPGDILLARNTGLRRGKSGLRRLMGQAIISHHRSAFLPIKKRPINQWKVCGLYSAGGLQVAINERNPPETISSNSTFLEESRSIVCEIWRNLLPPGSRVALAIYPDHWNVGDAAIWCSTRQLLTKIGVAVDYACDSWSYDPRRLEASVPDAPILLLGGGNLGDVYGNENSLRMRILVDFPGRRIIQLPQSIWYRSDSSAKAMARLLSRQSDFTLLLRDAQSLAFARTHFPVSSILCPDSAVALDVKGFVQAEKRPVVAVWRMDVESSVPLPLPSEDWIAYDWAWPENEIQSMNPAARRFQKWVGSAPIKTGLVPLKRLLAWRCVPWLWDHLACERLIRGYRLLSQGRVVITNRLHAHLLCTLMGKPHVVCNTMNGKIFDYHSTWRTDSHFVRFAADPEEAVRYAEELLSSCT